MLFVFSDYKDCLVYPVKKPNKDKGKVCGYEEERKAQSGSFDVNKFIGKKRKIERPFFEKLIQTQHFQNFIDDRLHPDGARDADG